MVSAQQLRKRKELAEKRRSILTCNDLKNIDSVLQYAESIKNVSINKELVTELRLKIASVLEKVEVVVK